MTIDTIYKFYCTLLTLLFCFFIVIFIIQYLLNYIIYSPDSYENIFTNK